VRHALASRGVAVIAAATAAQQVPAEVVPAVKRARRTAAFPFVRLAGQEEMKLALLLNVIDPSIGGVLIMGDRGTGKSVAVRLSELKFCPSAWSDMTAPPQPAAGKAALLINFSKSDGAA
jgi:hypothetical protein